MAVLEAAKTTRPPAAPPATAPTGPVWAAHRGAVVAGVVAVWVALWALLRNRFTLTLDTASTTDLHLRINEIRDSIDAGRNSNPLFLYVFNEIRLVIDALTNAISGLIAQPAFGRPVPLLGWLGVVAVVMFVAWALGNGRVSLLAGAVFVFFGLQGLWTQAMDTLALTLAAVLVSLLIGIPLGVWAGLSDRVNRVLTPVLDFMQTMPTFVYLAPLTLFFLIGPASAVIATLIYAAPPAIRITAHGIRSVAPATVEASVALGSTPRQTLFGVLIPVARRTIVLGINQTIMAALSMVTIAALIDAPGLGQNVLKALQTLDVGTAFNAGLSIVLMAIVLDRVTTAMSERVEVARLMTPQAIARRPYLLGAGALATLVCVYLSYTFANYAVFPKPEGSSLGYVGDDVARVADSVTTWTQTNLTFLTQSWKDVSTAWILDPVEHLLVESPWFVVFAVAVLLSLVIGNLRAAVTTAVCLAVVIGTGLWSDTMTTLAAVLVATVLTVLIGVLVGVWMGRSRGADRAIRPVLDAAQVLPSFVYLIPFVALFGATRFTAIVAAVVYSAPIAIKLVADGIRNVSATTVEAALSAGTSTLQMIRKVQLPMAREALVLATNQGLIYVLSMVVVGGLIGAGALGYDVVAGFRQSTYFGKGLAAGLAIVMLGVMLDRVTQAASGRTGGAKKR
ncbi:MAG: ABC transporter permease subunit [Actinobacteria bacterium]|nr:ABC transporter permease subunit [Actinomycetota bacterium]